MACATSPTVLRRATSQSCATLAKHRLRFSIGAALALIVVSGFVFGVAQTSGEPDRSRPSLDADLDHRAIAEMAHRLGNDRAQRFLKAVELMEMRLLAQRVTELHRDAIVTQSAVSPAMLRDYYEQHKKEFTEEPRFTAHHLLVYVKGNPAFPERGLSDARARAKAMEALASLRAGKGWREVAQRYSDDVATQLREGLIRDRQFGYFAPELERALRTQALGRPGEVIKTLFGYYVVEVVERTTENVPRPFEEVTELLRERLTQQLSRDAREAFMTPIWREVGFVLTAAGQSEAALSDEKAIAPDTILAEIAGKPITESDFRWFCNDALLPSQRMSVYSRPGARKNMLGGYLDMLVLAAKAKRDHLDRAPEFIRSRKAMAESLLLEFLQQAEPTRRVPQPKAADAERRSAEPPYLARNGAERGLAADSAPQLGSARGVTAPPQTKSDGFHSDPITPD